MTMGVAGPSLEIVLLLDLLDRAYDEAAWHGPNLRGALRRVNAEGAAWKPGPGRRSIGEIVIHSAYWKYNVRRRLRGDRRGSFGRKGSNWFVLPEPWTEATWRDAVMLLDDEHRVLRDAVADFPAGRLVEVPAGGKFTYAALIHGIAAHDLYHAGQVQLLKRLRHGGDD